MLDQFLRQVSSLWQSRFDLTIDPKPWIEAVLDYFSLSISRSPDLKIAEATTWPYLNSLLGVMPIVVVLALALLLFWSTRRWAVTFFCTLLFAFALLYGQSEFGQQSLWIACMTLIPGILLGLLLGYLHAAYSRTRILTWIALWIVLALPLIAVAAIAVGALQPNQFSVEAWALVSAPMGVMARGSAVALEHIDPELRRQARRLGASQSLQVRFLSFHLSVPALRAALHQAVMVYFFTAVALGAVGLPGIGREIWTILSAGDLAGTVIVGAKLWALAIALDVLLQMRGRGRLVKMMEA